MKTRYILIAASTIIVSLLLLQCNNYEFPESPYPGIESLPVSNINEEGATFNAEIKSLAGKKFINHGFVWGTDKDLSLRNDEKIILGSKEQTGIFSANISYGLLKGKTYYVRPFGTTEEGITIYGLITSFTSKSSSQPFIESILPTTGYCADTLTIKGKNFSSAAKNINVLFEGKNAQVVSATDTSVTCIVPANLIMSKAQISMTSLGIKSSNTFEFNMLAPVITGFYPDVVFSGDTLWIYGTNFHTSPHRNQVFIGDVIAEVISATTSTLTVMVPHSDNLKANPIRVTICGSSSVSEKQLMFNPPVITSISPLRAKTGSTVVITGDKFSNLREGNQVYFENNKAVVISASTNRLEVEVPKGIYNRRSFNIEVKVADQGTKSTEIFTIADAWLRKVDCNFQTFASTSFSIYNAGFVGLGTSYSLHTYSPIFNNWASIQANPVPGRYNAASFVIGDRVYIGLGTASNFAQRDFYSYDPTYVRWTRLKDFPRQVSNAIGFSANGKGYLIIETDGFRLWGYDPIRDEWTILKNVPVQNVHYRPDAGFLINNQIYIFYTDPINYQNQLWQYDIATDTWSRKANLPTLDASTLYQVKGFSIAGKGYIHGSQFLHRYNSETDTWDINLDGVSNRRRGAFAFVIQNKAYYGGGITNNETDNSFWEYDPEFEENK
jgi:hypothetical protein